VTPEEAVAARLLDITGVTDVVGSRVYVDTLPQAATFPAVLVQLVHEPTEYHLRGGLRDRARVQVDAYAAESDGVDAYTQVMTLADAIHGDDAGSGLSGWVGSVGSPGLAISGVLRIDRARGFEPDELRLLRQRQDYWVYFRV
jgi:hypothetical protein